MLDKAVKSCDEQMDRKLNLDLSVKLWLERSESGRLGTEGNPDVVLEKPSKDGHSVISRSSSRLSSVSQKREKLVLAQINLHILKLKQLLDEEERAIRAKRKLLEAEMKAEKAAVSLVIYEDDLKIFCPICAPPHYRFLDRKVPHKLVRPVWNKEHNQVYL